LGRGPDNRDGQLIAALFLATAVLFCSYRAVQLNFVHYDDDSYPYVYAHSKRDLLRIVDDIDKFAKRDEGTASSVVIVSENFWPLPWYLRDYTRVGYLGRMSPPGNAALLIGSSEQFDELDSMLQGRYTLVGQYELRPGVTLMLFARNNIVQPNEGLIRNLTEPE
jgi:predicted membrane-bound mannosyltransferase